MERGAVTAVQNKGTAVLAINYHSKISSAQIKSSILLAGLAASGITTVKEGQLFINGTAIPNLL